MTSAPEPEIYCFKCREKTSNQEVQEVVLKNGRPAMSGRCAVCGTRKFRMTAVKQ